MSTQQGSKLPALNDCGCCTGLVSRTPVNIYNRPGLNAVSYRAGTHEQFMQTMLARLSSLKQEQKQWSVVETRDTDDYAIALLDAWAAVADVLTFYQERIANESYLRTAVERFSVMHLGRLVGYELRPGVAAGTFLAFDVDENEGTAVVGAGTQVQSIPSGGGMPQTFETVETIHARSEWDSMKPRLTEKHPFTDEKGELLDRFYFKGVSTRLGPGDGVLIVPDDSSGAADPVFRLVSKVTPEPGLDRTEVCLQPPPPPTSILHAIAQILQPLQAKPKSAVALELLKVQGPFKASQLTVMAATKHFFVRNVFKNIHATRPVPPRVLVFRTRASIFGHNAPEWKSLPDDLHAAGKYPWSAWVDVMSLATYPSGSTAPAGARHVYLDNRYRGAVKNSWVVLQDGPHWQYYRIEESTDVSKSAFTISAKVNRLTIMSNDLERFAVRSTTVFVESEELELSPVRIDRGVAGTAIELDGFVEGLSAGQSIIVCGELADDIGNRACEHATIKDVEHELHDGYTVVMLKNALQNEYGRSTVTINANVAAATHGETKQEVLGSGDSRNPFQLFTLKAAPVTCVSAQTPDGMKSTLEVRVNDVVCKEVPDLVSLGGNEPGYTTRMNDEGKTDVIFGDGVHGARLPTGMENVEAVYRAGSGLGGNVEAGALKLLSKRPHGIAGVSNPLPATGGDDPEGRDQARRNMPLRLLTLDRIVSLRDYEDFARAFAGISKALATWTWRREEKCVFVTVAGPGGSTVPKGSATCRNLLSAMRKAGDPSVPLYVDSFTPVFFKCEGSVRIDARYAREKVLTAVETEIKKHFSFDAREFGQPATLSEIVALIQKVDGIISVEVDYLYRLDGDRALNAYLPAYIPHSRHGEGIRPAELLMLEPWPLTLGVVS